MEFVAEPIRVPASTAALDRLRSRWPEYATLFVYAALVAFAIPFHEPWADEAQAWQLARSLPLSVLFRTYIRYEGSPGLWHFLLWVLNRAHVSYSGMHWICGAIAVGATSLLVFRSPFPRYLKLTLPFTHFLLFQYAVVARNYVLAPLLLFTIALVWKKSPVFTAVLLGLLANVALHAAVISGGLAIAYCVEQVRERTNQKPGRRNRLLLGALFLLIFYAFAIWTAWPPHDVSISRVRGPSHSFPIWMMTSLVWGICQPWILSFLFWIIIGLCLKARNGLYYLLPVLLFSILSGAITANFWHVGLLVPLVICILWITWPSPDVEMSRYELPMRAAMLFLVGVQILWSAHAIRYDHYHAYSPDLATVQFLKPFVQKGDMIAVTSVNEPENQSFYAVGLLPYFGHNIYANQPDPFWSWSVNNPTEGRFPSALLSRPSVALVEIRLRGHDEFTDTRFAPIKLLSEKNYKLTNVFCGTMPEMLSFGITTCHLIFQPVESLQNPSFEGKNLYAAQARP